MTVGVSLLLYFLLILSRVRTDGKIQKITVRLKDMI